MTDYCGHCGHALVDSPTGGRIACHPDAAQYWSPHKPLPQDVRGHYQLTGESMHTQSEWYDQGIRRDHATLYLYVSPTGGFR